MHAPDPESSTRTAAPAPVRFRHVVWDWNGTLLDDSALCVHCMNTLLRSRRLPKLTLERYQALFDFPVIGYYRRLGFDFERESFEKLGTEFIETYEQCKRKCGLQAQTRTALESLRDAGLTQSVLSAYRQDTLDELLGYFGVREFFIRIIGADDHYANGKVEQGLGWIRELKVHPAQVVLIGDTTHDFEVAQAMGAACGLIPCGHHSRAKLATCGAPVFEDLLQAVRWIRDEPATEASVPAPSPRAGRPSA